MTQHAFARVTGFGLSVIPRAPYRIQYADETSHAIDIEHQSPNGPRFARLIPDNGGYKSKIDQHTESLFDVLDVESGPGINQWRIETTIFRCCWPSNYALCSNNFPNDPGPFDLVGTNHEMIYIQRPDNLPDVAKMCAPHQTVINIERSAESEWVDLEYDHEGLLWRQRHEVITLLGRRVAVTMQSPSQFADDAVIAARQISRSLTSHENAA
jgi:hypothetical protein